MGGGGVGDNKSSVSSQSFAKQQNHEAESFREASSCTKTPKGVHVGPQSLFNGHTVMLTCAPWTRKPTERGLNGPHPDGLWGHCSLCDNDKCLLGEGIANMCPSPSHKQESQDAWSLLPS